jgi:hypothetical protein
MQSQSASEWPIPGRVLVLDNKYELVSSAIAQLLQVGIPVLFWDGKGNPPNSFHGIRVILLDLALDDGSVRGVPTYYLKAIERLGKVPGPYVVLILSQDYTQDDPKNLVKTISDYELTIPGVVYPEGLSKEKLPDWKSLVQLVHTALKASKVFNLIFVWEGIQDRAKDAMLSELSSKELEKSIVEFARLVYSDVGEDAAAREFIARLARLYARAAESDAAVEQIASRLKELAELTLSGSEPAKTARVLQWLLMYANPAETDDWTGDIYKSVGNRYFIVMTPSCDIAHKKDQKLLVCGGFEVNREHALEKDCVLYSRDPRLQKKFLDSLSKGAALDSLADDVETNYVQDKNPYLIPAKFYRLWNYKLSREDRDTLLCFDFQEIMKLSREELAEKGFKKVKRLDSPFIDDMLLRFGSFSSRMGVPNVNRSPSRLEREARSPD